MILNSSSTTTTSNVLFEPVIRLHSVVFALDSDFQIRYKELIPVFLFAAKNRKEGR
jgi:hypothetical protein